MLRNLKEKIPGAPNFRYGEFVKSDTAIRLEIPNIPKEQHWKNIEKLAINILQPIRNQFGRIRITSGFRSVKLCKAIGSSPNSNHTRGEAADIEPWSFNVPLINVIKFIHDELDFRELIAEYFPHGWVHVAYREGSNTRVLKLKDAEHNYQKVSIEYLTDLY